MRTSRRNFLGKVLGAGAAAAALGGMTVGGFAAAVHNVDRPMVQRPSGLIVPEDFDMSSQFGDGIAGFTSSYNAEEQIIEYVLSARHPTGQHEYSRVESKDVDCPHKWAYRELSRMGIPIV